MSLYVLFFLLSQSDCAVAANSKAQEGQASWIPAKKKQYRGCEIRVDVVASMEPCLVV